MPLPDQIDDWPEDWRHAYEERAGIMEHDGGLSKERAEREAEAGLRRMYELRERVRRKR